MSFAEGHGTTELLMNEFGLGESEGVSIQTSRRTRTEERGDSEAGVNGHGSQEVLRRPERSSERLSLP